MKKEVLTAVAAVALFGFLGSTHADASTTPEIQANIPFAFTVENSTLPAGMYVVRRLDDAEPNVMEIRSKDRRLSVVFLVGEATTRTAPNEAELVFDTFGNRHFLSEVFQVGDSVGVEAMKGREELRLGKSESRTGRKSISAHSARAHETKM